VCDEDGHPIAGALVDAWQACATGRYNHSRDPNPAQLDPNFQYWGRTTTDEKGRYQLKTIVPGAYPASSDWMRPPHVHFKVSRRGFREVTTQMYFEGSPLNDADHILQELSEAEKRSVVVKFEPVSGERAKAEPGARVGAFDVTLRSFKPKSK
jgi:protocatechuate 3,4-dioxygenase beta subunit